MPCIGVIILSVAACVWWSMGMALSGHTAPPWFAIGIAVSLCLAAAAIRANRHMRSIPEADRRRIGRLVGWASGTEGVAILVAVNLLNWTGLQAYDVCAIAVIVGLHFIPLARMPHARIYNVTGTALVALGLAGCLLPEAARGLTVGTGGATVIWATCAFVIRRMMRQGSSPLLKKSHIEPGDAGNSLRRGPAAKLVG